MDKAGFDSLTQAIIVQAIKDYREAVRTLKRPAKEERYMKARQTIREVKVFLKSGWFEVLTDADGEYILKRLEVEANEPV